MTELTVEIPPGLLVLLLVATPALGILAWLLVRAAFDVGKRDLLPSVDVAHPIWMDRKGRFWTKARGGTRVATTDPYSTKLVPVANLPGVFVRVCGPGFNHNWGTALPPHLAPIVSVSLEEWRTIQEDIPPGYGGSTDLIVHSEDDHVGFCSMWDPFGRRWVILSDEDARRLV